MKTFEQFKSLKEEIWENVNQDNDKEVYIRISVNDIVRQLGIEKTSEFFKKFLNINAGVIEINQPYKYFPLEDPTCINYRQINYRHYNVGLHFYFDGFNYIYIEDDLIENDPVIHIIWHSFDKNIFNKICKEFNISNWEKYIVTNNANEFDPYQEEIWERKIIKNY